MSEVYCGIKFNVTFLNKVAPKHFDIEILGIWCEIFHEKNLTPPYPGGSYGNLSFRKDSSSFIITGSSIGLKENLSNDCFVEVLSVDINSREILVNGLRNPSSESMLHAALYKLRPDVNAIFHGHCRELLENAALLGIPKTLKEEPYGTIELVNGVLEIAGNTDFLIMKNHGFIAVGKTMNEAGEMSLEMLKKAL